MKNPDRRRIWKESAIAAGSKFNGSRAALSLFEECLPGRFVVHRRGIKRLPARSIASGGRQLLRIERDVK